MPRRRVSARAGLPVSDLAAMLRIAVPAPPPMNDGNTRTVGTTTGRIRTQPAPPATPEPTPQAEVPAAPVVPAWSLARGKGKMVFTVKSDRTPPVHLYLTAREAVKLASHLLANAGSLMDEEELTRPPTRG